MDIIKLYLEDIFQNLPKTREILNVKEEILLKMEHKYNMLKADGKKESEAISKVISEFSNINEILENANSSSKQEDKEKKISYMENEIERKTISLNEVKFFIKEKVNISKKIALGVFLCICSPICLILFSGTTLNKLGFAKIEFAISLIFLFVMVISAVILFVIYGLKMDKFKNLKKENSILDDMASNFIKKESEDFKDIFAKKIALGVALCIISILPIIITELIFDSEFIENICVVLLLIIVAFAVKIFIVAEMTNSIYKVFLEKEKHKNIKDNLLIKNIKAIYWPLVTIVYLLWSFNYNTWATSWIIWPIAALLFEVVSNIYINFRR